MMTESPKQFSNVGEIELVLALLVVEVFALVEFLLFGLKTDSIMLLLSEEDYYFSIFIFVNLMPNSELKSFKDCSYYYYRSRGPFLDSIR
jgi:hypothetical protein